MKHRLDKLLVMLSHAPTRSQAEHLISLGKVHVAGRVASKSGQMVDESADIRVTTSERYVSRAGLKLASVAAALGLDFTDQVVLDVGSSTGGFTDYALQHGAARVIAVDVGTEQLHPSLRGDPRIELHEKTDIRRVERASGVSSAKASAARVSPDEIQRETRHEAAAAGDTPSAIHIDTPDIILIDVSFISLRQVLPHIATLAGASTQIIAMVKPQFEATRQQLTKGGIVRNDRARRDILGDFEQWAKQYFVIANKADSDVAGTHGNRERFYQLSLLKK